MEKNISGVYAITNKTNNKKYVGSSKNISYRHGVHFSKLRNNKHNNQHLQNAVNKYGIENFIFEILEIVDDGRLLFKEQQYINKYSWDMLYNKTKIAGSGGGDIRRKKLYLIDLLGNIVNKFRSGVELSKYLNYCRGIEYNKINTDSIKRKKYRIVTPEFYENNIDIIKSWKHYSCESTHRTKEFKEKKFIVFNNKQIHKFNTYKGIASMLNITHQRVSQIYKLLEKSSNEKYFHKNSGFYLASVKKKL
jgi:group I intron endonuclease